MSKKDRLTRLSDEETEQVSGGAQAIPDLPRERQAEVKKKRCVRKEKKYVVRPASDD